jgi:hypothetical protein
LQNLFTGSPTAYDPYDEKEESDYKKDFQDYKANMQKGLGLEELSDENFESQYKEFYEGFLGKGDFNHMLYVVAGNIAPLDMAYVQKKYSLFFINVWDDHGERRDVVGWLGDAAVAKPFADPSFGPDDYIADLDAANIVSIMERRGLSLLDALNGYYGARPNRAEAFLRYRYESEGSEDNYKEIEAKVFERAGVGTLDKLNKKWPDSYRFLVSLKNGSDEMGSHE